MIYNCYSETPGFYATIPISKIQKNCEFDTIRAWDMEGHYKDIPREDLARLVGSHKVKLLQNKQSGEWYIPSFSWRKFF